MTPMTTARGYEELLAPDAASGPYEYATLFAADGWMARRRAKRRFKLLKRVDARLRQILHPEERVFFLTAGTTTSFVEGFFMGWAAAHLNRRVLVFTTERVLMVQADHRNRPRELVSQIPYTNIAAVKSAWNGICRITLQGGAKLNFQGVPKAERAFLNQFLGEVVRPVPASPNAASNRIEHLCPKCFVPVAAFPAECPACGAGFKSARKAAQLSFLFPGLGDFYLGHRGFAVMEMVGTGYLWLILVIAPLLAGGVISEDGERVPLDFAYWAFVAVFLSAVHGMDAAMTRHFARKGHHPLQG